jgi:hypothetical protein
VWPFCDNTGLPIPDRDRIALHRSDNKPPPRLSYALCFFSSACSLFLALPVFAAASL